MEVTDTPSAMTDRLRRGRAVRCGILSGWYRGAGVRNGMGKRKY